MLLFFLNDTIHICKIIMMKHTKKRLFFHQCPQFQLIIMEHKGNERAVGLLLAELDVGNVHSA